MRNSQRAVAAALGLLVGIMVALAVWVRLVAEPLPELSGERVSRSYELTGFDAVEIGGMSWQAAIARGDAWSVTVEVPVELVDEVEARVEGDRLSLDYDGGWWGGGFPDGVALEATITMPALETLEVSGTSNVSFSGFDGASLTLELSGAGELDGAASRFDALTLDMSGMMNVDLDDVPVTDAEVDVSGFGNVTLRMAGGRLTGDISGFGNLEYFGTVSEESLDESGFVNVRSRN
jgi:hypothetical protein